MITSSVLTLANIYLYLRHPRTVRRYVRRNGRFPDVAAPISYSERMLWRKLEDEVWVKASHGCNFNQRVRADEPGRDELERLARGWLSTVWGTSRSEWAYTQVPPRIFVEESVGNATADMLEFDARLRGSPDPRVGHRARQAAGSVERVPRSRRPPRPGPRRSTG